VSDNSSGFWAKLKRPSIKYSLLTLLTVGFVSGVFFWGGFNTAMEATNTLEFCIGCHEMKDNVYQEYKKTIHYSNRTGVRAYCSDCHVPKDWTHKMMRKIQASRNSMARSWERSTLRRSSKPSAWNWRPMNGRA
jgi:cytochrome c-type protein NapC